MELVDYISSKGNLNEITPLLHTENFSQQLMHFITGTD